MNKPVVEVKVRAVLPTAAGRAVFLGNEAKSFVIYVDDVVGTAITMYMSGVQKERPLTHDLMGNLMTALGAKVERVVINDLKTATYFARLIVSAENELQARKIVELDARPSDGIALAVAQHAPIYVTRDVWNQVEDMSEILRKMAEQAGQERGGDEPEEGAEGEEEQP